MDSEIMEPLARRFEPIHEFLKVYIRVIKLLMIAANDVEVIDQLWSI